MVVGSKLRELRRMRGLTQAEVAANVHCDRSYLSRIENNEASPPLDLLRALCEFFGKSLDQLVSAPPAHDAKGDLLVRRCLSLLHEGRVAEAQTLAVAGWWEHLSGPADVADQLFDVLMYAPNRDPEVLTILLANMFRRAAEGHLDERFFQYGFRLQRALAECGELGLSRIFCQALLALGPNPRDTFRLTLSLGTTLFRLRDSHMASAMYSKARTLWRQELDKANLGRALHGLGACHLQWNDVRPAIVFTEAACDIYRDEDSALYYLAVQNLAMAYQLNGDGDAARIHLELCARYWSDQGNQAQLQDIQRLLGGLRIG